MKEVLTNSSTGSRVDQFNFLNFIPNVLNRFKLPLYIIDGADFVIREGIRTFKGCGSIKTPPHTERQPRQSFGLMPVYSINICCRMTSTSTIEYFFNSLSVSPDNLRTCSSIS